MSLYNYLMAQTMQGRSGLSLVSKGKLAGIRPYSHRKEELVKALDEYLSDEDNIMDIWNSLENYEQDLFIEFLRSSTIDISDVNYIFSKHGKEQPFEKRYSHYYTFDSFFPEDSKGGLFLFNKGIPYPIKKILMQFVKPYTPTYRPIKSLPMDEISILVEIGESYATDFTKLLQLFNKKKLRVTKVNQYPTKSSILKMNSVLTIKEWETVDYEEVEEVRNVEKTIRLFGLFQLMKASSLIQLDNNQIRLGEKADTFLKLTPVEKCKLLLEGYKNSQSIEELGRIPEHKLEWDYNHPLHCRELILNHLSQCPLNEWISIQELMISIKKEDRKFLHAFGNIYLHNRDDNYYTSLNDWTNINERFIQVVLLEYLAMMGIVDVALAVNYSDYERYYAVVYSRLTPFGGHILGVNDEYTYKKSISKSGFIIQPNFEIIVSEGSMKIIHTLFFDGFAEEISSHPVPIYKISFKSIVKALDQGMKVEDIIEYLERYKENPLPQNVCTTLEDWRRESEKIRIRTITVLEAQDPYLMEELKSYKTIGRHIKNELQYTVEIGKKESKKIKREIEKKGRFCILEE